MVGHFIGVVSCILDLINSIKGNGGALRIEVIFIDNFAKMYLKFALFLPALRKSYSFYSVPTFKLCYVLNYDKDKMKMSILVFFFNPKVPNIKQNDLILNLTPENKL